MLAILCFTQPCEVWIKDHRIPSVSICSSHGKLCLGGIQLLLGHNFPFLTTTYLHVDIFNPELGQKQGFFGPPTTSSCPRTQSLNAPLPAAILSCQNFKVKWQFFCWKFNADQHCKKSQQNLSDNTYFFDSQCSYIFQSIGLEYKDMFCGKCDQIGGSIEMTK